MAMSSAVLLERAAAGLQAVWVLALTMDLEASASASLSQVEGSRDAGRTRGAYVPKAEIGGF